jgi:hypothetical protein
MPTASSKSQRSFEMRISLSAGFLVACWDFILMFRGWVVAPQSELAGANILFFFLGVLPLFGTIAAMFRKRWGAWVMIFSPLLALTGLIFTKNEDWLPIVIVMAITVGPTVALGVILLRLMPNERESAVY